jgi:hypothetical protein
MRQFEPVRYVLVARETTGRKVARVSTPRHLWELSGPHLSLLRQHPTAMTIEVVSWPWKQGETLDDQEPIACAQRSTELPGAIVWPKDRDLKTLERDLEQQAGKEKK